MHTESVTLLACLCARLQVVLVQSYDGVNLPQTLNRKKGPDNKSIWVKPSTTGGFFSELITLQMGEREIEFREKAEARERDLMSKMSLSRKFQSLQDGSGPPDGLQSRASIAITPRPSAPQASLTPSASLQARAGAGTAAKSALAATSAVLVPALSPEPSAAPSSMTGARLAEELSLVEKLRQPVDQGLPNGVTKDMFKDVQITESVSKFLHVRCMHWLQQRVCVYNIAWALIAEECEGTMCRLRCVQRNRFVPRALHHFNSTCLSNLK